jgi:hypothetical protein
MPPRLVVDPAPAIRLCEHGNEARIGWIELPVRNPERVIFIEKLLVGGILGECLLQRMEHGELVFLLGMPVIDTMRPFGEGIEFAVRLVRGLCRFWKILKSHSHRFRVR